jgi:uncharacterized DUF497 family protein
MIQDLRFEWDPEKDSDNIKKHKISFQEASTAFLDENGLLIEDPDHSDAEDRFVLLGLSSSLRILLVCHCYRAGGGVIRLISARKADRQERLEYVRRVHP